MTAANHGFEWEMVSAIGTVAAVVVALGISLVGALSQLSARRARARVARALLQPQLTRLFKEISSSGMNPGVLSGRWSYETVRLVMQIGDVIDNECGAVEARLQDLSGRELELISEVLSGARAIADAFDGFRRHNESVQLDLASFITSGVYKEAEKLLAMQSDVMKALGYKDYEPARMPKRTPIESEVAS